MTPNQQAESAPAKEFKAGDLAESTNDALVTKVFEMSDPNQGVNDFTITLECQLEEKHESRWVDFDDTEGFGYAVASNKDNGYIFIKATIVRNVAVHPSSTNAPDARPAALGHDGLTAGTSASSRPPRRKIGRTTGCQRPSVPALRNGQRLPNTNCRRSARRSGSSSRFLRFPSTVDT